MRKKLGTRLRNPPRKMATFPPCPVTKTQVFSCQPTHPGGQKTSSVNLKHKLQCELTTYMDSFGTKYMSHDKKICLYHKDFLNSSKINQATWTCSDPAMKCMRWFFPKKDYIIRSRYEVRRAGRDLLSEDQVA